MVIGILVKWTEIGRCGVDILATIAMVSGSKDVFEDGTMTPRRIGAVFIMLNKPVIWTRLEADVAYHEAVHLRLYPCSFMTCVSKVIYAVSSRYASKDFSCTNFRAKLTLGIIGQSKDKLNVVGV